MNQRLLQATKRFLVWQPVKVIVLALVVVFSLSDLLSAGNPPLSGTYTIGGTAPDYMTISDAVSDLNVIGVAGPVTFNIRNGTYNEKFRIGHIDGSSKMNDVTFQSETGNAANVMIQAKVDTNAALWSLDTTGFLTFQNLTFRNDTTYAYDMWEMTGSAREIAFIDCHFESAATSSEYALYFYPDTAWNLSVVGCSFDTMRNPIYIEGYYDSLYSVFINENTFNYTSDYPIELYNGVEVECVGNSVTEFCDEAFYFEYCNGLTIADNFVAYAEDEAFYVYYCSDVLIRDNEMDWVSYGIYAEECRGMEVINNYAAYSNSDWVYIEYSENVLVDSNDIDSADGEFIYLYECEHIMITNNHADYAYYSVVYVENSDTGDVVISNNVCEGYVDDYGIYVEDVVGHTTIMNNDFNGYIDEYGIYVDDVNGVTIENNHIDSSQYFAIYVYDSYGPTEIHDNSIDWSDDGFIYAEYCSKEVNITGNEMGKSEGDGIYVYESDSTSYVADNVMDSVDGYGIYVYDAGDQTTIQENQLHFSDSEGLYIDGGTGVLIENNDFGETRWYGIELSDIDSACIVRNNEVGSGLEEQGMYGIYGYQFNPGSHPFEITANRFHCVDEYTGIYLYYVDCKAANPGIVANNMVSGVDYGLEIYSCNNMEVFNNSFSQFGQVYNAMILSDDTTLNVYNNIFQYNNTDTNYTVFEFYSSEFTLDNNVYHLSVGNDFAPNAKTLTEHQDSNGVDLNSFEADPMFYNDTFDLHVCNGADLYEAGTAISGITEDIDGNERNVTTPTIGAQELAQGDGAPIAAFDFSGISLNIAFENLTENNGLDFEWDFGDGTTSNDENPDHAYATEGTYIVELTSENDCGSSTKVDTVIVVDTTTTGITDLTGNDAVKLYPNPTNGVFNIKMPANTSEEITLDIYDVQGISILRKVVSSGTNLIQIDASDFASGIYLVNVQIENKVIRHKLMKQ